MENSAQLQRLLDSNLLDAYRCDRQEAQYFNIDLTFIDCKSSKGNPLNTVNWVNFTINSNPFLKAIILLLKRLLKENNLNSPYDGGLSSFSCIVMVVAYCQLNYSGNIGQIFFEILDYYGNYFNFKRVMIDTNTPRLITK